jgi:hypothetical protein
MTTGLTYNEYVKQICTLAVLNWQDIGGVVYPVDYQNDPTNVALNPSQVAFPQMITYAENRIYRDLDFVFTSVATTAYGLTIGSRQIVVPQGTFVVPEQINVITPAGVTDPNLGTRNSLTPVTREFLDTVYNIASQTGLPQYFCVFDDYRFLVGPYPDQNYSCEIVGTYRPDSLSSSNTTTFISLYLPDVFLMASMVYLSGYQRNWGKQSDDPQMAQSYESQYQTLLKGAMVEEARKKFESVAWTSQSPSIVASPNR